MPTAATAAGTATTGAPVVGFIAAVESRLGDLLLGQLIGFVGHDGRSAVETRVAGVVDLLTIGQHAVRRAVRAGEGVDTYLTEHGQTGCRQCRRAENHESLRHQKTALHRSLALGMPV